jgi:integrase
MASVKYRLNRPKEKTGELKKVPVSILISYYHAGVAVEDLSTGQKTIPVKWDNNRIKGDKGMLINKYLNELETNLLNAHLVHRASGPALEAIVRRIIKGETEDTSQKKTVIEVVQQFIAQYEREKDPATVKRYRVLVNKLRAYNPDLTFDQLDQNFYDSFKNFLYDNPNSVYSGYGLRFDLVERIYHVQPFGPGVHDLSPIGLFDDVVFKYLVNLKTVLAWASKRGYVVNPSYKEWQIIKREYTPITLTKEELEKIESLDLPKHLDVARDYLSLECRTGQRISDLRRFKREDLLDGVWTFFQKKGNRIKSKLIELPLDGFAAPALVILQKYNYELPKISEQKLNVHIKKVCEMAGVDSEMYIERWAGSKKVRISGRKYSFLSTHTGKKSFITILAGEGIPVSILSILTGTSQRTIERHYLGQIPVSKVREHLKKVEDNQSLMRKSS